MSDTAPNTGALVIAILVVALIFGAAGGAPLLVGLFSLLGPIIRLLFTLVVYVLPLMIRFLPLIAPGLFVWGLWTGQPAVLALLGWITFFGLHAYLGLQVYERFPMLMHGRNWYVFLPDHLRQHPYVLGRDTPAKEVSYMVALSASLLDLLVSGIGWLGFHLLAVPPYFWLAGSIFCLCLIAAVWFNHRQLHSKDEMRGISLKGPPKTWTEVSDTVAPERNLSGPDRSAAHSDPTPSTRPFTRRHATEELSARHMRTLHDRTAQYQDRRSGETTVEDTVADQSTDDKTPSELDEPTEGTYDPYAD